jgi:hypothetical protein
MLITTQISWLSIFNRQLGWLKNLGHWLWQLKIADQIIIFGRHKVYNNQMTLFWVVSNCFLGNLTSFWPRLTLY